MQVKNRTRSNVMFLSQLCDNIQRVMFLVICKRMITYARSRKNGMFNLFFRNNWNDTFVAFVL